MARVGACVPCLFDHRALESCPFGSISAAVASSSVNPPLTDGLVDTLVRLWVAAAAEGRTVGFDRSATHDSLGHAVAPHWDAVIDGTTDLLVAPDAVTPQGFALLARDTTAPAWAHRGRVDLVLAPGGEDHDDLAEALLAGVEERARQRELDTLAVLLPVGARAMAAPFRARGYAVVARLPRWLRVEGTPTDAEVLLRDTAPPSGAVADEPPPERPAGAAGAATLGRSGVRLPIRRLDPDLPLPRYARPGDAGLDLHAREDRILPPGTRAVMPTGVAVAIPAGYVGLVHPRSGAAVRSGLSIVNTPGTIDAGYRGELQVPLINLDPSAKIVVRRGDRIAQLLIQRVEHAELEEVEALPDGVRGVDGFGSTGR